MFTPMRENQVEKELEHEMEAGIMKRTIGMSGDSAVYSFKFEFKFRVKGLC